MNYQAADILIAEDCRNDAEFALAAFDEIELANRVVIVPNGVEALDYLYRQGRFIGRLGPDPVVLLLDIKLPKLNGLEVLRRINEDPSLIHIPVVMLSSSPEERDLTEARNLGAKAYVVKPVGFKEFMDAIKTVGKFWAVLNAPPHATTAATPQHPQGQDLETGCSDGSRVSELHSVPRTCAAVRVG